MERGFETEMGSKQKLADMCDNINQNKPCFSLTPFGRGNALFVFLNFSSMRDLVFLLEERKQVLVT